VEPNDITLRDYFAGQALAGVFSQVDYLGDIRFDLIAIDCYDVADAMLKQSKEIQWPRH